MKTVYTLCLHFIGGLIAALLSNALLGMSYTLPRALAFAALFAVIVTLLRVCCRKGRDHS